MKRVTLAGLMLAALDPAHAEDFKLESPDIGPDKSFGQEFVQLLRLLRWQQAVRVELERRTARHEKLRRRSLRSGRCARSRLLAVVSHRHPVIDNLSAPRCGQRRRNQIPEESKQLKNSFGRAGYGGSCPPTSDKPHTYVVTVYAVKVPKLDIPADTGAAQALPIVQANALGKATLTYQYGR
ncbi:MAG TPA: hypothetical protein VNA21_07405 [Steroidobacteraceae bacterium]|nr:hypothetical protein [Steroidobacteraceae bacterium]